MRERMTQEDLKYNKEKTIFTTADLELQYCIAEYPLIKVVNVFSMAKEKPRLVAQLAQGNDFQWGGSYNKKDKHYYDRAMRIVHDLEQQKDRI